MHLACCSLVLCIDGHTCSTEIEAFRADVSEAKAKLEELLVGEIEGGISVG